MHVAPSELPILFIPAQPDIEAGISQSQPQVLGERSSDLFSLSQKSFPVTRGWSQRT